MGGGAHCAFSFPNAPAEASSSGDYGVDATLTHFTEQTMNHDTPEDDDDDRIELITISLALGVLPDVRALREIVRSDWGDKDLKAIQASILRLVDQISRNIHEIAKNAGLPDVVGPTRQRDLDVNWGTPEKSD